MSANELPVSGSFESTEKEKPSGDTAICSARNPVGLATSSSNAITNRVPAGAPRGGSGRPAGSSSSESNQPPLEVNTMFVFDQFPNGTEPGSIGRVQLVPLSVLTATHAEEAPSAAPAVWRPWTLQASARGRRWVGEPARERLKRRR